MTLPRKGTRQIVVDGEVYRWRKSKSFGRNGDWYGTVIVEEPSGKIFKATIDAEYDSAIPSVIEALIRDPEKRKLNWGRSETGVRVTVVW